MLKRNLTDPQIYFLSGLRLLRHGNYEEALRDFDKAIELKPHFAEARAHKGGALWSLKRYAEAVQCCDKAIELKSDLAEAWTYRGVASFGLKKYGEVIENLDKGIKLEPDSAHAWFIRGTALFALEKYGEAEQAFDEAIKLEPDSADAWFIRGTALFVLEKYGEAIQSLDKAIRLKPCSAEARVVRGSVYLEQSEYEGAKKDFRQSQKIASKEKNTGLENFSNGMYYWASGMDKYINKDQGKSAKDEFRTGSRLCRQSKSCHAIARCLEFFKAHIEIDSKFQKITHPINVNYLKKQAQQIFNELEGLPNRFGIEIESDKGYPEIFVAKRNILYLLVCVLNEKDLEKKLLDETRKIFERFPFSAWLRRFNKISVLLHRLVKYKTFEEMQEHEAEILELTPNLSLIDRDSTKKGMKIKTSEEVVMFLKEHIMIMKDMKHILKQNQLEKEKTKFPKEKSEGKTDITIEKDETAQREELKRIHNLIEECRKNPRKDEYAEIVGESKDVKDIMETVKKIKKSEKVTVLICGESGTGKEVIARAIHSRGERKGQHFVTIDCSQFDLQLMGSDLFGHAKGAFTGAIKDKPGLFEDANDGVAFLDEIHTLDIKLQARLLRVIQTGEFRRIGENKIRKVDIQIMCATNIDLEQAVREKHFRNDLYFRLNVFRIDVSPLRERREDIFFLLEYFSNKDVKESGKEKKEFTHKAMDALLLYDWLGNVRELENVIERLYLAVESKTITEEDISKYVYKFHPKPSETKKSEKERVEEAIIKSRTQPEAAKLLGMPLSTMKSKLKKYHLQARDFKRRQNQ